jgi:hypothetical protein
MEFRQHVIELNAQLSDFVVPLNRNLCREILSHGDLLHRLGQFLYRLCFGIGFTERSHLCAYAPAEQHDPRESDRGGNR